MFETMEPPKKFFIVGGTLDRTAASYVQRPLDNELLNDLLAGEYCSVLAARQMGKSSLMVRTAEELRKKGVRTATIDITSIGSLITPSQWYLGLVSRLASDLGLDVDAQTWWESMGSKSPVQRFSDFLRDVVLEKVRESVVVFVDEIDSTLQLNFTDDFFAAIRATYNARSRDEIYKRLTFVLLGVARPGDLIKDRARTPYNIGINIDVTDFQIKELDAFRTILDKYYPNQGNNILEWVLNWTGGQPYLTQKLCSEVVKHTSNPYTEDELSKLVEQLFLGDKARTETNLVTIRDRVGHSPYAAKMLHIYRQVLENKQVLAEERSIEQNELKLTGLVKVNPQGMLQVRNRIYAYVFDATWVKSSMPVTPAQRLTVVTSIIAVLAIAVAGYFYYQQQNQTAEIQARTYIDNFNNSNSPDVRITSLAGLFRLGDQYTEQARGLFDSLNHDQQLALFDLTLPANVGNELVVVVGGVYQNVENTHEGNTLLKAMASTLTQSAVPSATTLTLEINTWLDGRAAATRHDYPSAISLYTRAFEYSKDRNNKNATILMERANTYTLSEQYAETLADYNNAVGIDVGKATLVQNAILENQMLADYFRENSSSYPNLSSVIAVPTKIPSPTFTQTSLPTLTLSPTKASTTTPTPTSILNTTYCSWYEETGGKHFVLVGNCKCVDGSCSCAEASYRSGDMYLQKRPTYQWQYSISKKNEIKLHKGACS